MATAGLRRLPTSPGIITWCVSVVRRWKDWARQVTVRCGDFVSGLRCELWAVRALWVMGWRGACELIRGARGRGVAQFSVRTFMLLIAMVMLAMVLVVLAAACGGICDAGLMPLCCGWVCLCVGWHRTPACVKEEPP